MHTTIMIGRGTRRRYRQGRGGYRGGIHRYGHGPKMAAFKRMVKKELNLENDTYSHT